MRTTLILLLLTLKFTFLSAENLSIDDVRKLFNEAIIDEQKAEELIKLINDGKISPLLLGYRGAAKMLIAKHVFNVFQKFRYFQDGKVDMEEAISKDPASPELRFLRFCCQSNTPWILNYKSNLKDDKEMLISSVRKKEGLNEGVRKNIISVLSLTE